jgi:multidrug efflux system membrane fusion protein
MSSSVKPNAVSVTRHSLLMNMFLSPSSRLCVLLLACLMAASCKRRAPAAPPPVPVYAAPVVQRAVPLTRNAVGLVQPLHMVALQSQVDGVIAKVHFVEGDEVKAGTLLITLDQRPFQSALLSAQAQLAQARANAGKADSDYERYSLLHDQKAVSDSDLTQYATAATSGKATVAVQEAAVVNARLNLDYTEIRAPIDGRTSRLAQREGALVKANDSAQPLLILNQMAPIGVAFSLPESDLAAVRAALAAGPVPVSATAQGDGQRPVPGRLDYLDNTVGTTTGTIALRAAFDNRDGALWPGQFVDVIAHVGELPNALVVPATAIVAGQAGNQIFVVKPDGTIDIRVVHTGVTDGDDVVVLDAVQTGETVVTDGQLRLVPGTHVTVQTPGAKAAAAPAGAKSHQRP